MSNTILANPAERAAIYGLLSELWYDAPSPELLASLAGFAESSSEASDVNDSFVRLAEAASQADAEELAIEYTRLFIGPKNHLPPYQSVWREHQLEGESASIMRQYADVLGLADQTDHLANQLFAMQKILLAAAEDPSDDLASLAASFLHQHLSWPEALCKGVSTKTELAFYRELAELTWRYLESDLAPE